jgi:hypothetical protein
MTKITKTITAALLAAFLVGGFTAAADAAPAPYRHTADRVSLDYTKVSPIAAMRPR